MESEVRLAIVNAVRRDAATKQYLERFREQLMVEIRRVEEHLSERMSRLEDRVSRLEERVAVPEAKVSLLTRIVFAFNLLMLIAVIGILPRLLWQR